MAARINDQASDQQQQLEENVSADIVDGSSKHIEDENENGGEEEEDEEDDIDFNPFLKGTPSPEASSSLSSEVEVLDGSSKLSGEVVRNYNGGDSEHGEEVVMLNNASPQSKKGEQEPVHRKSKKRKTVSRNQHEGCSVREKGDSSLNCVINSDDEDAICKRTRARYSLARFTLDELETFLQETDDEDDLQHVDDEEEYRKFLADVLQGGDGDGQSAQENEIADDDEDNDADFEIELEELLDSDADGSTKEKYQKIEYQRAGRRPETRQNRRQKVSAQYKKKLFEQTKRPLRPILPVLPNGTVASFPIISGKGLTLSSAPSYLSSTVDEGLINGFTLQQIGQLHCLIHEHVQLLIQVFSLCILDPSRQHITSQIKELILEMLNKRDEAVVSRSVQYPDICFHPPFICPSVVDDLPGFRPAQCFPGSYPVPSMQIVVSQDTSFSNGRDVHASNKEMNSSQTAGFFWVPLIRGPVMSILDVASLALVRKYIDDVYNAVQEYRQRHVDSNCDTLYEKEQLFHLPYFPPFSEVNGEVARQNTPPSSNSPLYPPHQQPPKKTLAASIVESVKKQSVALVPKDISRLAQRFFSLFNPALFPHKPPPPAVANRVLFTDSEDELLALGIMEYNTDWKAIQQRFLPCKSTHQIFVRQKNRCSSKAPENSIKAVRRMKTSPLSAQELERIQEGLRVFKLDWMSVWRFVVPHRDPSLLPRQWRIAIGTQRSYKLDAAKKEKRRLYEAKRRRSKAAHNWQVASEKEDNQAECTGGENNSGDDYVDNNSNEAYVHQAFLADWRPGSSCLIPLEIPFSDLGGKDLPSHALSREQPTGYGVGAINMHRFPYSFNYYQHPHASSRSTTLQSCWPHRTDGANLVKLAPELPPVNLPPSVRVISRSAFKSNQSAVCAKKSTTGVDNGIAGKGNDVSQLQHIPHFSTTNSSKTKRDTSNQVTEATAGEERSCDSDLHLHPLLFQAPEDGSLPYYPLHRSAGNSSSFSLFSGNQPQLNLSLLHNPHQSHHLIESSNKSSKTKESTTTSYDIDFHPLLQRNDEENTEQYASLGGKSSQPQNPSSTSQSRQLVFSGPLATAPKSVILHEKSNELDLEIHLSSRSSKEKTRGGRVTDANIQWSAANTTKTGNMKDACKSDGPCHQHSESCPIGQSKTVSDVDASAVPSNDVNTCNMNDIGDQPHHEIVMEREELSDSDEEIEENVEFECEEMTDSDGEDRSGCETIPEAQEQEVQSSARNKDVTDADHGDPKCGWKSPDHPKGNSSVLPIGTPTFLKLGLTSLDKDASNISWLSLDSCAPVDSPQDKAKHQEAILDEAQTAKNLASGRPNRTCDKAAQSMKGLSTQNDVMDMAQQLSLGPLAVSRLRRPRKRGSRINKSTGTTENSKIDRSSRE